jgi:D-alanine-D-alanine ligase
MKIVFTHNIKRSSTEEEAEFDTPETISAITEAIKDLGFEVEPLETSGPASLTIARLEALNPDLIFNTSEGSVGRFREAFYPGIFEQLGVPFTGSDAYACTVTLDKQLTKMMVASWGVPTPRSLLVTKMDEIKGMDLHFPVMMKPNFEGSSKGITVDSVAENMDEILERLPRLLATYSSGMLLEEFIVGKDVTIPYIDGVSPKTGGVLAPVEYVFAADIVKSRKYSIYDYTLKNEYSDKVDVRVPADITEEVARKITLYAQIIFKNLGIRDFGRIDFRVTPDDRIYFIEINALPSLEPGAGIYRAAEEVGITNPNDVIQAIIKSSIRRYNINVKKKSKRFSLKNLRIGFTFNEKRVIPSESPQTDIEAEFDSPKTLNSIREAIRSFGHEVIDLEATQELPEKLVHTNVDMVFNIAEGIRGLYRESQVPAILELMDIPYTGSDAATLALALDKSLAKRIVREAGILTPGFCLFVSGREKLPPHLRFPLLVKPVAEGSSKGVLKKSVVHTEEELMQSVREVIEYYKQGALVEEYLCGREFTVALLGEKRPKVLPPMEIVFLNPLDKFPVYSFQHKLDSNPEVRYDAPAKIDPTFRARLENVARKAFIALGCRDVARIDLRLDLEGRINFIECNPLPGLTPGWSDLCLIAESAGINYRTLIAEIMAPTIRRLKEKRKLLMQKTSTQEGSYENGDFTAPTGP